MIDENIEDRVMDEFSIPHIAFPQDTIQQKKALARRISTLKCEELLLASTMAFSYEGIIAGITIEQIEYFAKNAPINFKKELIKSILTEYRMKEVFEIAKSMDDDLGEGIMQNQNRIKKVIQYIQDNGAVFQF
ncbi:MAG: hypothetical protein HGA36_01140 [Candidatus Moranbacteria bacterium]|nr:hypothetical protein [Candidatus Moranbacteria bacterium]